MHKKTEYDPKAGKTFLHPGRQALISYEGEVMGYLGEVHPAVADTYGIGTRAYVAVLDILNVVKHASFDRKYEGVAKFPAMKRDLSMVMKKDIFVGQLEKIFKDKGGKLLESYELFDVYEGIQLGPDKKSMAFSVVFTPADEEFTTERVEGFVKKILKNLEKTLDIRLRA